MRLTKDQSVIIVSFCVCTIVYAAGDCCVKPILEKSQFTPVGLCQRFSHNHIHTAGIKLIETALILTDRTTLILTDVLRCFSNKNTIKYLDLDISGNFSGNLDLVANHALRANLALLSLFIQIQDLAGLCEPGIKTQLEGSLLCICYCATLVYS